MTDKEKANLWLLLKAALEMVFYLDFVLVNYNDLNTKIAGGGRSPFQWGGDQLTPEEAIACLPLQHEVILMIFF